MYTAAKIIIPILNNSLGCKAKIPKLNQLRLPPLTTPKPGIKTNINNRKQTKIIGL